MTSKMLAEQAKLLNSYKQIQRQNDEHNRMKVLKAAKNPYQEMRLKYLQPAYEIKIPTKTIIASQTPIQI